MEKLVVAIEIKYDEHSGPVPETDELTAKLNDVLSRDWVLDPTGDERVVGFGVTVTNPRREKVDSGEYSEFLDNINRYVLGEE